MRNTLLCMLGSLLLNRLLCGRTPAAKKAVVTLHPNWPKIYREERITLRCEIKNGGNSKWEYEWKTTTSIKLSNNDQFMITAYVFHNGYYKCRGRDISGQFKTKWSGAFKLTVYANKPRPVLTVSPSWLSPNTSVTLTCKIEHPSAGWRFYWYKAVPQPAKRNYRVLRLPGSTNGTEEDSYIINGPTHTARYQCRVRRGHSVFYSHYSESEFVWSKELNSAASLTVNPDREQHFTSESVSLSCEGNSAEWRVMRFTQTGQRSLCHGWGIMTGSTCTIHSLQYSGAVYWCESGSGDYSNAVNITIQLSKPESSPVIMLLFTGVLTGILLVILLLLLYCFIKSDLLRFPSFRASQPQPQSSDQDQPVNQEQQYSSLLTGGVCVYESLGGSEDTGNDGRDKEYSDVVSHSIQLKRLNKRSERDDPEERLDCNVNPLSTTES